MRLNGLIIINMNILYLVNNISTTSFPLDVVERLKNNLNIKLKVAYLSSNDQKRIKNFESIKIGGGKKNILQNIIDLIRIIKQHEINIIHTHHFHTTLIARIIKLLNFKFKLITTYHTDLKRYSFLRKKFITFLVSKNDGLIFNSKSTEYSIKELNLNLPYNKVIYNGIDLKYFKNQFLKSKINKHKIIKICMIGRLVPVKNYEFIFNTFSEIRNLKFKIHVYGDGVLKEDLKSLVNDLGLSNNIEFHGLVTRDKLLFELPNYDIFINSSFYEGFGNALIEAKLAGLKIIAPDLKVFHEVLGNSISYYINNDKESFISSFSDLLNTKTNIDDINVLSQKYSLETHIENILEFYQKLHVSKNK